MSKVAELDPYGVKWMGEIPSRWSAAPTKRHFNIKLGKMLQNNPASDDDRLVPYLKAIHVLWSSVNTYDLPEMWANPSEIRQYKVSSGDLLVCEGGEVGRAGIVNDLPEDCIIQNALHRVCAKDSGYVRFLMYALHVISSTGWFDVLCNKATIAHFTREKFAELRIPLPTLNEQRAIAAFLDRETGRIDGLIEKKQRQIEVLQEKRAAVISHSVTKGLNPGVKMKDSGIEWLGKIPEHWEVWKGSHILRLYGGHAPESVVVSSGGSLYFKVDDLNQEEGERRLYLNTSSLNVETFSSLKAIAPPLILIPKRGAAIATNKVRVATKSCLFDSNIMGIQVLRKCSVEYMAYVLLTRGLWDIADVSTIPQINNKHINPLKIPVPPLDEQRAIVEDIDTEAEKIDSLVAKVQESIDTLCEYRTALISAAVTGKLTFERS